MARSMNIYNLIIINVLVVIGLCALQSYGEPSWASPEVFPIFTDEVRFHASLRQLRLENLKGFGGGHICTGALFAFDKVIAPAYCVHTLLGQEFISIPPTEFIVVFGTLSLYDVENAVVRNIMSYISHPKYDGLSNNIVVLVLSEVIPFEHSRITPIELTSQEYYTGTWGVIIGWNIMPVEEAYKDLMTVRVVVESDIKCRKAYPISNFHSIIQGMLCIAVATDETNGTCLDSNGGILIVENILVGINTWGLGCGNKDNPILYTDLYHFRDWINNIDDRTFSFRWSNNGFVHKINSIFKVLLSLEIARATTIIHLI